MRKWFKRKPKVVKMNLGDTLHISVDVGGTRNILVFNDVTSRLNGPTTATFVSPDVFLR